ncbi:MAG TPA: cyclic nucleotide-binding domain-containing protein [Burkholderiales bacterium]|nr:cyclic nucleotide-binding domain-containing protein [Burkholderiales bacterium]
MNELDFTNASIDGIYNPAIARACFNSLGEACTVAKDEAFFAENEKSGHMYLLVEGEVRLFRRKTVLDIVRSGEVFGEIAAITGRPRTAWAVARTPCKALRLDAAQFRGAIRATPEFALMLMSIMINRTGLALALLARAGKLSERLAAKDSRVFTKEVIEDLAKALGNPQPVKVPARKTVMREGDIGGDMYAVLAGRIDVLIKDITVDHIGPGGLIGELALVDNSKRAATAIAETDSTLLAFSREDFLSLVRSNPRFAVTILKSVANRLTRMTFTSA